MNHLKFLGKLSEITQQVTLTSGRYLEMRWLGVYTGYDKIRSGVLTMSGKVKFKKVTSAKRKRRSQRERRGELLKNTSQPNVFYGLGLQSKNFSQLNEMVHGGFDFELFEKFHETSGLPFSRIAELIGVPKRGVARRRAHGRLGCNESDRLFRISRIFGLAVELYEGDISAAREWMDTPKSALNGNVPLDLASTDVGAHEVEKFIMRLEHGVFL